MNVKLHNLTVITRLTSPLLKHQRYTLFLAGLFSFGLYEYLFWLRSAYKTCHHLMDDCNVLPAEWHANPDCTNAHEKAHDIESSAHALTAQALNIRGES